MKVHTMFGSAMLALSFLAAPAFAQDKAAKQAEIVKHTDAALQRFYEKKP